LAFLSSFPEDELVLRKIDQYIDNFKETYIMVKGFENDAREKVEKLVEFATDVRMAFLLLVPRLADDDVLFTLLAIACSEH